MSHVHGVGPLTWNIAAKRFNKIQDLSHKTRRQVAKRVFIQWIRGEVLAFTDLSSNTYTITSKIFDICCTLRCSFTGKICYAGRASGEKQEDGGVHANTTVKNEGSHNNYNKHVSHDIQHRRTNIQRERTGKPRHMGEINLSLSSNKRSDLFIQVTGDVPTCDYSQKAFSPVFAEL